MNNIRVKPVAYAAFAGNGKIRLWSQEPGNIDATAAVDGFPVLPLYTAPPDQSDEIAALRARAEMAEKERDELRSALAEAHKRGRNEAFEEAAAIARKPFAEGSPISSQCVPFISAIVSAIRAKVTP